MFVGIAIICDDFFVPALEIICEVLQLSDDVAGATFMAAGSSAPELAASTVSLISPDAGSEIGVGTIVGSAIFNILIIIGATVLATGKHAPAGLETGDAGLLLLRGCDCRDRGYLRGWAHRLVGRAHLRPLLRLLHRLHGV